MIILKNTKKTTRVILVLILCCLAATFQSCKKKRSEMAAILFKRTHNTVFKDIDPDEFTAFFKRELAREKSAMGNPQLITKHYNQNDYEPDFVLYHLWNGDLQAMIDKYHTANEHGLDPKLFQPDQLSALMAKFYDQNAIKTPGDAYKYMAQLEILAANSLINYSSVLQYGLISPRKIYSRYFIKTQRPDSISINKVFSVEDMRAYLDSIQPKDAQYLALQKAYLDGYKAPKLSKEETRRILLVNMERLRWRNKPTENKYVYVNIPDFHLDVIDSGKSILGMKVCVGEGRNKNYLNSLENYNDTCKTDNPFPHETPLLSSVIHSVQVNPIWNIPKSIATKEIVIEAAKDPYYLANRNINVYKNDKLVEDPETIDWSKVTKENSEYEFKQQPGADNSLGKIKFLFENRSSVYLHDTPAKDAFSYSMRAVSHGCVRLEKPLDLAHTLFRDTVKYNLIAKDMEEDDPTSEDIALRPRVPVYITYVTCWADSTGKLQFRRDVYGLDIVLYDHLKKYLPAE
ncbi:MAG: L,D-transpeptidase family protein [Mucilaginibacter sp.]|nr:L,D-transpeptidase family protein [Mucilaginibacter sp.]